MNVNNLKLSACQQSVEVADRDHLTKHKHICTTQGNNYEIKDVKVLGKNDSEDYDQYFSLKQQPFVGRNSVLVADLKSCTRRNVDGKVIIKTYKNSLNYAVNETAVNQYLKSITKHHPNIAEYLETAYDEEADTCFIVTKMYESVDLFDYMADRGKPMRERDAAKIFSSVVNCVQHLHNHGVAHRDLSAMNILLTKEHGEDNVRLIDFEMSVVMPRKKDGKHSQLLPLNKSTGTRKYMAPEIYTPQTTDYNPFQSDVWSLGVILFFMLVGCELYEEPSECDMRFQCVVTGRMADMLRLWNVKISPDALDLLQSMLHFNPAKRLTIDEVRNHPWLIKQLDAHSKL